MNFGADNLTNQDPRLEAALDEALAPEAVPAGLNDRIVARTARLLEAAPLGVLARIDRFYRWPQAVAAVLVGAVTLAIAFNATRIVTGAHALVTVHRDLAALPAYHLPSDVAPIDISSATQSVDATMHGYNSDLDAVEDALNKGLADIEQPDDADDTGVF